VYMKKSTAVQKIGIKIRFI